MKSFRHTKHGFASLLLISMSGTLAVSEDRLPTSPLPSTHYVAQREIRRESTLATPSSKSIPENPLALTFERLESNAPFSEKSVPSEKSIAPIPHTTKKQVLDKASIEYIPQRNLRVAPLPPESKETLSPTANASLPVAEPGFSTDEPVNPVESSISIAELQAIAEQCNPTLRLLRGKLGAAKGDWVQAGLKPNPTVGYSAEEIGDAGTAGKQGIVVEQEITTGGKRKLDRSVAGWEVNAAKHRLNMQYQAIQNDVRARAYELLAAQKTVRIDQTLEELSRRSALIAEKLGLAGEVSKIDLLQIRAKANEAAAALKTAKNDELLAWKRLSTMIGRPDMPPQAVSDRLEAVHPEIDADAAWCTLQGRSPQLAIAQAEIQRCRAALARQHAGKKPDITVSGGLHYDFAEKQTLGNVGVGVPLQIFDRNQGNIMKAQAELAAAQREWERQSLVLYEQFMEIYTTIQSRHEQVVQYREKILPDVRTALNLSMKGYEQREYSYMDVLNAQRLYLEAETQYVKALKEYAIACVYLDGCLAVGGLEETGK